jgi:hypothetical protein
MSWNEVGEWFITEPETLLPIDFTSRLAIKVSDIAGYRSTWNWAGYCYQYLDISDVGLTRINRKINIAIQEPILFVPEVFKPNYALKFVCADWINALTLTIFEDSMPLYFQDSSNSLVSAATTSVSVTVSSNTTPVLLLTANANRKKFSLRNKGTKAALIGFSATFTAANAFMSLAAGAIFEPEINYTGDVFALAINANSNTDIQVTEFI